MGWKLLPAMKLDRDLSSLLPHSLEGDGADARLGMKALVDCRDTARNPLDDSAEVVVLKLLISRQHTVSEAERGSGLTVVSRGEAPRCGFRE